ncbi:MAG: hypothetical protein ABFE01_29120 [Phycisphaerales bacterium]
MAKKRALLLTIALGTPICALVIGVLGYWQFRLKPWFVFEKTRYGNMGEIAAAIGDFTTDQKRIPENLGEVVRQGYLPERSPIYECPLLHGSLRDRAIGYLDCEFDVRFEPNEAIVSLPRAAIDRCHLEKAPAHVIECRIDKSGNFVSP